MQLAQALRALQPPPGGQAQPVDLLLSANWPQGAARLCSPSVLAAAASAAGCDSTALSAASDAGAPPLAQLAQAACPRYHAAGGAGLFFLRPPYRNAAAPLRSAVTRFVALAPLGAQPPTNKWLHALSLTPASEMGAAALAAPAPDATASPYELRPAAPFALPPPPAEPAQWRWAESSRPQKRLRSADAGPPSAERTVFLRNVAFSLGEEALAAHFSQFGEVIDVRMAADRDGRPRGFGHIEFRSVDGAVAALGASGTALRGARSWWRGRRRR